MGQLTYRQAWPLKKTENKTSSLIGNVFLTMGESKPEQPHRVGILCGLEILVSDFSLPGLLDWCGPGLNCKRNRLQEFADASDPKKNTPR